MAFPQYARRSYAGGTKALTLSAPFTATALSFAVTGTFSEWPTGTNGNFGITVDEGLPTEEKIRCATFNPATSIVTVAVASPTTGRGYDGTAAVGHVPNSAIPQVQLTWSAKEATEANYAVAETVGKVTTAGDLLIASGANAFSRLAIGAATDVLVSTGSSAHWVTIAARFGLATNVATVVNVGGNPHQLGGSTKAARADHGHLFHVAGFGQILGSGTGTNSPFFQTWYGGKTITGPTHRVSIALPVAYTQYLAGAWVSAVFPTGGPNSATGAIITQTHTTLAAVELVVEVATTITAVTLSLLTLGF